jgi:hypothetical protein
MKFSQDEIESKPEIARIFVEHKRWHVVYKLVFEHEGKLYAAYWHKGATECQESEWAGEDGEGKIDCQEVKQVPQLAIAYLTDAERADPVSKAVTAIEKILAT